MNIPAKKKAISTICTVEREALIETSKTLYAIFRSTRLNFLFNYLQEIQGYRENKYTKYMSRADLREGLIKLFCSRGESMDEAESTTELNLI